MRKPQSFTSELVKWKIVMKKIFAVNYSLVIPQMTNKIFTVDCKAREEVSGYKGARSIVPGDLSSKDSGRKWV